MENLVNQFETHGLRTVLLTNITYIYIHSVQRCVQLPFHDPGHLYKAGPDLCFEQIAGSGFCSEIVELLVSTTGSRWSKRPKFTVTRAPATPAWSSSNWWKVVNWGSHPLIRQPPIDRWKDTICQWDLAKLSPDNTTATSLRASTPTVCCRHKAQPETMDSSDHSSQLYFHKLTRFICSLLLHLRRDMCVCVQGKSRGSVA